MTTKTNTPTAELAELEAAIPAARRRVEEVDRERGAAERDVDRARNRHLALEHDRGAGREVDEEEVAAALEAIAEAETAADGRVWSARKAGAEEAIEEAERARHDWLAANFGSLSAELIERDVAVTAELNKAWSALRAAANRYALQQRAWRPVASFGGVDPEALPAAAPLAGIPAEALQALDAGVEPPTPPTLR
jgi:hypothetical protein